MTNHSTRLITETRFLILARFTTVERIRRVFHTGSNSELVELMTPPLTPQSTSLNRVSVFPGTQREGWLCVPVMGSCILDLSVMAAPAMASLDQTCCGAHTSTALYGIRRHLDARFRLPQM